MNFNNIEESAVCMALNVGKTIEYTGHVKIKGKLIPCKCKGRIAGFSPYLARIVIVELDSVIDKVYRYCHPINFTPEFMNERYVIFDKFKNSTKLQPIQITSICTELI